MSRRLLFVSFLVGLWGLTSTALGQFDPQLVGWWTFDEGSGTVAEDYSGHGNDGTFVNDPQWVSGVMGGALEFAGDSDDQVELTTVLPVGSSSNTVALWIKVPSVGQEGLDAGERVGDVLGSYPDSPNTNWELHGSGQMRLWWNNGQIDARGTTDLRDDTWHHVAWVRDKEAGACTMYIDGQLEASTTTVGTDITFETTHRIGGDNRGDPPCFHGQMDDLQVYSRALSQDEFGTIMKGPIDYRMASSPQPAHEAVDVLRDGVLGWSAGVHAATHDVYFGTSRADVSEADRANPLEVLISQGQTAPTHTLADCPQYGQTYYWRVDEVNAAPDNTIFKGDLWSFTVEPFAYAVENIVATSNATSEAASGIEKTIDGSGLDVADLHSVDSADMWLGIADGADPVSIQYDFDGVYKLHQMRVWNYNVEFEPMLGFGLKDVTVEYSANGADWTVLEEAVFTQATARADYAANTVVDFGGAAVQSVKLTVNSGYGLLSQYGLSEIRFLYIPAAARKPQPAHGEADTPVAVDLNWRAGREAVSHEVYFGTDAEALPLSDTVSGASYEPGALDLATTYYWRIDEVNDAEAVPAWEGPVWSFTTQTFFVVDDFEGYTDDEGQRIYETWIDGWVNETGSFVGYTDAPFAERVIVNSGRQSMPLFYDNTGVAVAEAELALGQDWTTNGIQGLSLYFYGDPDNTGHFYVKINGTKIPYDGDITDITQAVWQLWSIDLSTVGGDLSNVTSLVIGIEDAGAAGVIYIDDIRLIGP
jgi:Concanavalin A-like lectin/glucanases superfamily